MAATALGRLSARHIALIIIGLLTVFGLGGSSLATADAAPHLGLEPVPGRLVSDGGWLVTEGTPVRAEVDRLGDFASSATVLMVQVNVTRAASAGSLRLAGRGDARPTAAQIAFPAGNSSTTTLLSRTAAYDLVAWSSTRVRVQLTAMSDLPGQTSSSEPQPGQTNLIEPLLVAAARPAPDGAITLKGSWWTAPVLGHGNIPVAGVRAVWLSVQIKGSEAGSASFATAQADHPRLGLVPITPGWITSLVLVVVDSTGAIGFSLKSGAISQYRLVVVGWVAAADAATDSVKIASQLVLVAPKLLDTDLPRRSHGHWLVRVKLPTKVIPPTASAVLVQAQIKTNRAGQLRVGRTASAAIKANAQASHLPAQSYGTMMLHLTPGPGRRGYLLVPPGTVLDRLIVVGYIASNGGSVVAGAAGPR